MHVKFENSNEAVRTEFVRTILSSVTEGLEEATAVAALTMFVKGIAKVPLGPVERDRLTAFVSLVVTECVRYPDNLNGLIDDLADVAHDAEAGGTLVYEFHRKVSLKSASS